MSTYRYVPENFSQAQQGAGRKTAIALFCVVGSWREPQYPSVEEEYDSLSAALRSKNLMIW